MLNYLRRHGYGVFPLYIFQLDTMDAERPEVIKATGEPQTFSAIVGSDGTENERNSYAGI